MIKEFEDLENLHRYFRKAINTKLSSDLLRSKKNICINLAKRIEKYLVENQDTLPDKEFHETVKFTRIWHHEIIKTIELKLQHNKTSSPPHKTTHHTLTGVAKTATNNLHYTNPYKSHTKQKITTMATNNETMSFDIKQAMSLIPTYDGNADALGAFTDAAHLLDELTPADQATTAIKFLRIRLVGKARQGLPQNINSINELILDVQRRCRSRETPDAITAKLNQIKTTNTNEFCDEIENLTQKLKFLYLEQGVPEITANTLAMKPGLNSLIAAVQNKELKTILKAGKFTNIEEAVQKVQEYTTDANLSTENNGTHNIYTAQRFRNQNRFRDDRVQQQNNNYQRINSNRGNNFNNNNYRNNYHRGTFRNFHNNHSFRQNGNNRQPQYNNRGRRNMNFYPQNSSRNFQQRDNRIFLVNPNQPSIEANTASIRTNNTPRANQLQAIEYPTENFLGEDYTQ